MDRERKRKPEKRARNKDTRKKENKGREKRKRRTKKRREKAGVGAFMNQRVAPFILPSSLVHVLLITARD